MLYQEDRNDFNAPILLEHRTARTHSSDDRERSERPMKRWDSSILSEKSERWKKMNERLKEFDYEKRKREDPDLDFVQIEGQLFLKSVNSLITVTKKEEQKDADDTKVQVFSN